MSKRKKPGSQTNAGQKQDRNQRSRLELERDAYLKQTFSRIVGCSFKLITPRFARVVGIRPIESKGDVFSDSGFHAYANTNTTERFTLAFRDGWESSAAGTSCRFKFSPLVTQTTVDAGGIGNVVTGQSGETIGLLGFNLIGETEASTTFTHTAISVAITEVELRSQIEFRGNIEFGASKNAT